ncbi:MAG: hypothetical protein WBM78_13085 [Desulfobacterales bacterium]
MELAGYIHLNPLRANVVSSLSELNAYKYSGNTALALGNKNSWQHASYVLSYFGDSLRSARGKWDIRQPTWPKSLTEQ